MVGCGMKSRPLSSIHLAAIIKCITKCDVFNQRAVFRRWPLKPERRHKLSIEIAESQYQQNQDSNRSYSDLAVVRPAIAGRLP